MRNFVRRLVESDATCGGKAQQLARLIVAGLPVPLGFVVDGRAFEAVSGLRVPGSPEEVGHALARAAEALEAGIDTIVPPELREAVARATSELLSDGTERLAVRSSAAIEDGAQGAAAGVFASIVDVPANELWHAIRAVWASALAPLAASYVRQREGSSQIIMSVIIQRFVVGERATIYTRPPGAPGCDEVWIQRDGQPVTKRARDEDDALVKLALAAEAQVAEATLGADVELVVDPTTTWIVQARPIVHRTRPVMQPPPPSVLAALVADGRRWTWDVAHNPDPLSVAQSELVERVERAGVAPWEMRLCAGYLYTTPKHAIEPPPVLADRAALDAQVAEIEREIATILIDDVVALEDAVARYVKFYELWSRRVVPLVAAARQGLRPDDLRGARPSAVEATLCAAARDELDEASAIARLGSRSVAWDVAAPTFAEAPEIVREAIARMRLALALDASSGLALVDPAADSGFELARGGADLAERDDVWFAAAQWMVRRSLLARAAKRGLDVDDVFWLPFEDLRASTGDVDDARRRAGAARSAARRAARWAMPIVVGGGVDPDAADKRASLHGFGHGGRVRGRVVRIASLVSAGAQAIGPADVVVVRAVTPAMAVLVVGCAALVSETGGPLDHGAALARELGIPSVVGCRDAWLLLADEMIVTVDGTLATVEIDVEITESVPKSGD